MNEKQRLERVLLDNPHITFKKVRPVLEYTGIAKKLAKKLDTPEMHRAIALAMTEPFGVFTDEKGNRVNWADLKHSWLDNVNPQTSTKEVIESIAPSDKENHYWNLVRQCLEDMSGKSSSEASTSEWKYAEDALGGWLAERMPYPAPEKRI